MYQLLGQQHGQRVIQLLLHIQRHMRLLIQRVKVRVEAHQPHITRLDGLLIGQRVTLRVIQLRQRI
jgi:hypothetical protein